MNTSKILLAHKNPIVLKNLADELKRRRVRADILLTQDEMEMVHMQFLYPARVVLVDLDFPHVERILQCVDADPLQPIVCVCSDEGSGRDMPRTAQFAACRHAFKNAPVGVICDQLEDMLAESISPAERAAARSRRCEDARRLLFLVGASPNLKGCRYLRLALEMAGEDARLLENLEGRLYPAIALRCGDKVSNVERSMRYAMNSIWRRMEPESRMDLFQCSNPPGGKRFLGALYRRVEDSQAFSQAAGELFSDTTVFRPDARTDYLH